MHKDEAFALLQSFLEYNGYEPPEDVPEDADTWRGISPEVAFQFFEEKGELAFYAPICSFEETPSEAFLGRCRQEADGGTADMAGGTLEFDSKRNSLYLARAYRSPLPVEQLTTDVVALQDAALVWDDDVLGRVESSA